MDDEIADMAAKYLLSYTTTASEEGKYWCKTIAGDLADILRGEYISVIVREGEEDG